MKGDSNVYQVKPACSNEGRWEAGWIIKLEIEEFWVM